MHVEHVLSSIMNRVAAQIRDPDEEKSDFVFWFFLVAGFNFFTLKKETGSIFGTNFGSKNGDMLGAPLN